MKTREYVITYEMSHMYVLNNGSLSSVFATKCQKVNVDCRPVGHYLFASSYYGICIKDVLYMGFVSMPLIR